MTKLNYWEKRQAESMVEYMQTAEDVANQISTLYLKASRYISFLADDIFEKYQTKYKLSKQEAIHLLNTMQDKSSINELLEKLRSESDSKNKQELLKKLEAPAYQARIERLQHLQNQIDYVMRNVYQQEKIFSTSHYMDLANTAYYKSMFHLQQQAGVAFSFSHIDNKTISHVISSKWSGSNYSERIWKNTQSLAKDVKEELLINLITGRTNREAADAISDKYASGASAARRLVRTESNYIATEMNFKAYEEAGVEKYCYLAVLDLRTSELCRNLDRKIFPVTKRKPGVNCPPMHPWCRSTTIAVINEELLNKLRRSAIDPATGKTIKIPMSMSYHDWYNKYVKGKPEAELEEKKIKNRSSDMAQWKKYQKVLGENVPDSLDKFQDMKYNESGKWKYAKGLKQYLEKYSDSDKRFYDIQEELKENNINQGIALPAKSKQAFILPEGKREPYHIMHRMLERGITDDAVRSYMDNAKCMFIQWGGQRQVFYSDNGVCVVTRKGDEWIYKTAWGSVDFDESTIKILEVINKHVK